MRIGGRELKRMLAALGAKQNYVAAANMLRIYQHPLELYQRYLFAGGEYPAIVAVKTPIGRYDLQLYCSDDVLTLNEIFCRNDYRANSLATVYVDFGSNIGISAAYFLTRNKVGFAYLFEPLPQNVDRLRHNLSAVDARYSLEICAVGLENGKVKFGWEPTGRYGGIENKVGNWITVDCIDSNEVLGRILDKHGKIDVLKIDIETLEQEVTRRIPADMARRIETIYVENRFQSNPLSGTHTYRQYGSIAQFFRKAT